MSKRSLMVALVVFFSCAIASAADALPALKAGMTPDEVRTLLGGPPRKTARQVMYGHYHEVWFYDQPQPVWVEFDCRKGAEARVINVHTEIRTKP
jgi:hypothetical protein